MFGVEYSKDDSLVPQAHNVNLSIMRNRQGVGTWAMVAVMLEEDLLVRSIWVWSEASSDVIFSSASERVLLCDACVFVCE